MLEWCGTLPYKDKTLHWVKSVKQATLPSIVSCFMVVRFLGQLITPRNRCSNPKRNYPWENILTTYDKSSANWVWRGGWGVDCHEALANKAGQVYYLRDHPYIMSANGLGGWVQKMATSADCINANIVDGSESPKMCRRILGMVFNENLACLLGPISCT